MVLIFNIIRVGTYQTFSFISFQPSDYQYTLLEYFVHYEVPPSTVMQWYLDSMSRSMVDYYVRDLEEWTELSSATEFVSASLRHPPLAGPRNFRNDALPHKALIFCILRA